MTGNILDEFGDIIDEEDEVETYPCSLCRIQMEKAVLLCDACIEFLDHFALSPEDVGKLTSYLKTGETDWQSRPKTFKIVKDVFGMYIVEE